MLAIFEQVIQGTGVAEAEISLNRFITNEKTWGPPGVSGRLRSSSSVGPFWRWWVERQPEG